MTSRADVATISRRLAAAYERGEPASLADFQPLSLETGYAIQEAFVTERLSREGPVVGYKLGFTNEAVRRETGVEEPVYGRLLDATVGVAAVSASSFVAPRAEAEIAVRLGESLPVSASRASVESTVSVAMPAIEVVDSRTGTWDLDAGTAVADNSLAARLVTGPERSLADVPPLADVGVTLRAPDGERTGRGAAVLGDPLTAVTWLSEALSDPLPAGTLVSTGSLTETAPLCAGEPITATFESLGTVSLRVD